MEISASLAVQEPSRPRRLISSGQAAASQAVFDLRFHPVMHWGRDLVLEKLRAQAVPAGPLGAVVLRPGFRHRQPGLSQRRLLQGHPGAGGERLLRPLEAGQRHRSGDAGDGPIDHHPAPLPGTPARSSPAATRSPSAWNTAPAYCPAQGRPAARHHRALVGQPHPALQTRLNLAPNWLRGNSALGGAVGS